MTSQIPSHPNNSAHGPLSDFKPNTRCPSTRLQSQSACSSVRFRGLCVVDYFLLYLQLGRNPDTEFCLSPHKCMFLSVCGTIQEANKQAFQRQKIFFRRSYVPTKKLSTKHKCPFFLCVMRQKPERLDQEIDKSRSQTNVTRTLARKSCLNSKVKTTATAEAN